MRPEQSVDTAATRVVRALAAALAVQDYAGIAGGPTPRSGLRGAAGILRDNLERLQLIRKEKAPYLSDHHGPLELLTEFEFYRSLMEESPASLDEEHHR